MISRQRLAVVVGGVICLTGCSATPDDQVLPAPTPSVATATATLPTPTTSPTSTTPSPTEQPKKVKPDVPPSQPTRLEIGGAHPIAAAVYPYGGPELTPPGGNYQDVFLWTRRGLPGDGATDSTYLFGHTYSGPTAGVFDDLQSVAIGERVLVHTTGPLRYCVTDKFAVPKEQLASEARVWAIQPLRARRQSLVLIACFLSSDGSRQTNKNIVVIAERC